MNIELKPIGFVRSCYLDKFGTPRQSGLVPEARAEIKFEPWVQAEYSLEGLKEFSHVWVIYGFHKSKSENFHPKIHPPRMGGDSIGVFASRSPHRPNPIGLSLVTIEEITGDKLVVSGVDFIEGTPVYDLKPYLPATESVPNAKDGWTAGISASEIQVHWGEEQLAKLEEWKRDWKQPDLQNLIERSLKLDPRPLVYRGFEGSDQSKYRSTHAMRIYRGDVHFRFVSSKQIEVVKTLDLLPE